LDVTIHRRRRKKNSGRLFIQTSVGDTPAPELSGTGFSLRWGSRLSSSLAGLYTELDLKNSRAVLRRGNKLFSDRSLNEMAAWRATRDWGCVGPRAAGDWSAGGEKMWCGRIGRS